MINLELRFLYALWSMVTAWLFTFSTKIQVEKNHNPALVTFYSMIVALLCWIFLFLYKGENPWNILLCFLLWLSNGILYLITTLTRIESLKFIDTSIYFPIYKSLAPLFLVVIAILFLWEKLSIKESIWVILWIAVPLILIWKNKKSNNTKRWIKFMIIWLATAIWAAILVKIWAIYKVNMVLYTIFSLWAWSILSILLHRNNTKKHSKYSLLHIKRTWIITWVLNFTAFYFFVKAIEIWNNLWIVYTLQSLYILVPIILSIIIYKEHFDTKKLIAIILTIATIFFLG